jgi:hypothetical protein
MGCVTCVAPTEYIRSISSSGPSNSALVSSRPSHTQDQGIAGPFRGGWSSRPTDRQPAAAGRRGGGLYRANLRNLA